MLNLTRRRLVVLCLCCLRLVREFKWLLKVEIMTLPLKHGSGPAATSNKRMRLHFNKIGYQIYGKEQSRRVPSHRAKPGNPGYGFRLARWRDTLHNEDDRLHCEGLMRRLFSTRLPPSAHAKTCHVRKRTPFLPVPAPARKLLSSFEGIGYARI